MAIVKIMSSILQSESDSSDTSSVSSEILNSDNIIHDSNKVESKIPISASIVLGRLPADKQSRLEQKEVKELENKIPIRFIPVGSTPSINPNIFKISSEQTVSTLIRFLVKRLKLKSNVVYLYILSSFQPNPDEKIGDLYNNFKVNNELIVNYCHTIAFG